MAKRRPSGIMPSAPKVNNGVLKCDFPGAHLLPFESVEFKHVDDRGSWSDARRKRKGKPIVNIAVKLRGSNLYFEVRYGISWPLVSENGPFEAYLTTLPFDTTDPQTRVAIDTFRAHLQGAAHTWREQEVKRGNVSVGSSLGHSIDVKSLGIRL